MKSLLLALVLGLGATSAQAWDWRAVDWRLGLAYASGLGDVTDLHEENLRAEGLDANVDLKFPLGITAGVAYDWPSGMRADITLGPTFFIGGEVSHFELPVGASIGYNFAHGAEVSPYVRIGVVHHIASGDYEAGSSPGLLVAAGVDFRKLTVEIAFDDAEVEFEAAQCEQGGGGTVCRPGREKLNTYEVIASVFWRFR
jgi:opacity protein-like surface antigen